MDSTIELECGMCEEHWDVACTTQDGMTDLINEDDANCPICGNVAE